MTTLAHISPEHARQSFPDMTFASEVTDSFAWQRCRSHPSTGQDWVYSLRVGTTAFRSTEHSAPLLVSPAWMSALAMCSLW